MRVEGIRFKASRRAPREIMTSPQCEAIVGRVTESVMGAADSIGSARYACKVRQGRSRVHGVVYTPSVHAMNSNAKHKSLIKAIKRSGAK